MNEIIAVVITGLCGIVATLISAKSTRNRMSEELRERAAVTDNEISHIKNEMSEMKADIKEHNGYAKMYAATAAVNEEKIKVINHRIDDLERSKKNE